MSSLVSHDQKLLLRYLLASVVALGVDMLAFLLLLDIGFPAAAASALAYVLGIIVHWLISSRKVFATSVAGRGIARTRQKAMFLLSALMGLGLTTTIVGTGSWAGIDPRTAKIFAIGVSFFATWLVRKNLVFRKHPYRAE